MNRYSTLALTPPAEARRGRVCSNTAGRRGRRAAGGWKRTGAAALGVLLIGAGLCSPVPAAEWTGESSIDLGAIRDSNIRLTAGPHETASGYVAAARFDVRRRTEISQTDLDAAVAHTRYTTEDLDSRTESRLRLNGERQTSERGRLGLDAEYRRDTLFETAIIRTDIGDERDVDVGLSNEVQVRRDYLFLRPFWNWLLTERSAVRIAYRLTDVDFSNDAGTGLVEYQDHLVSGTYTRRLSPRTDFNVTANAARYRPDAADTDSQTLQLLAGMARAFSENVRGSFALGASRTKEQVPGQEERSSGVVTTARLRQEAELSRLEGVISRDVTPSGIGRALRTDQVRVFWTRQVAPAVEFVLDARWLRTRVVEGVDPDANRRYYELSPRLRWRWLEDLSVVGSYRYRKQTLDVGAESASSNTVFFGLSYRL